MQYKSEQILPRLNSYGRLNEAYIKIRSLTLSRLNSCSRLNEAFTKLHRYDLGSI